VLTTDVQQTTSPQTAAKATRSEGHPNRTETVMNLIQHIRRFAGVLAGLAGALVAFGATPAFASLPPEPGGPAGSSVPPVPVHTIVAGGMPGWQITLIAVGAALLAAIAAVLVDRARAARRRTITAAA
jgi:hypothetical protein